MKTDYSFLDASIIATLAKRPLRLCEILTVAEVRNPALRLNIRRAGVSPSDSAEVTINERLQALRRGGKIDYDPHTSRWVHIEFS